MARTPSPPPYRCAECGWTTTKWVGRCGECQAWGTVEEVGAPRTRTTTPQPGRTPAVPIGQVDVATARAVPSGIPELDRVLGGGFVPGAVILLAGEPGVGKSTLLLETAATWARGGRNSIPVSCHPLAAFCPTVIGPERPGRNGPPGVSGCLLYESTRMQERTKATNARAGGHKTHKQTQPQHTAQHTAKHARY